MEKIFTAIVCLINLLGYASACNAEAAGCNNASCAPANCKADTLNSRSNDFNYYLSHFQYFKGEKLNTEFFSYNDINGPKVIYTDFYKFFPYDSVAFNCDRKEPYYKPSYKMDKGNFYLISIRSCCDLPFEGFPYEAPTLVTYDKSGNIIDFEIIGRGSDVDSYVIETTDNDNELKVTQYSFNDEGPYSRAYSGVCKISEYTIKVNSNGIIDKNTIREYTGNVTLPLDW